MNLAHLISSIPYPGGTFATIGAAADGGQRDLACGIRSESQMMCLDFLKIQSPSPLRIDRCESSAPTATMSPGRLFLDRMARQHCPSPLHRHEFHRMLAGSEGLVYHRTVTSVLTGCLTERAHSRADNGQDCQVSLTLPPRDHRSWEQLGNNNKQTASNTGYRGAEKDKTSQ